jgi:hypothetical protein
MQSLQLPTDPYSNNKTIFLNLVLLVQSMCAMNCSTFAEDYCSYDKRISTYSRLANGRFAFKCFLEKKDVRVCTGFIWSKVGTSSTFLSTV